MNRLNLRPSSTGSLKASYPDVPSAPSTPKGPPASSTPRLLKILGAALVVTAALFILLTVAGLESRSRLSHTVVSSSSSSSSVQVVNPARIIQRTEQLYTIRTETIQDTTFHDAVSKRSKQGKGAQLVQQQPHGVASPHQSMTAEQLLQQSSGKPLDTTQPGQFPIAGELQPAVLPRKLPLRIKPLIKKTAIKKPPPPPPVPSTPPTPEQIAAAAQAPEGFDWEKYLWYYPDLRTAGINSEIAAKAHYVTSGKAEKRLYKRLNITLRYTACGGLFNQHYSHIAAFTLAAHLGASIVIPPALSRNSFADYFSQDPKKNQVYWQASPASIMWDVDYIRQYWQERGVAVTEAPHDRALPDLSRPGTAYPTYLPKNYTWNQVARLDNIYLKSLSLGFLLRLATTRLVNQAQSLPDPDTPLLLDCPCTLFMLRTNSAPRLVKESAMSLRFHPTMHGLADKISTALQLTTIKFNGLHLRMEDDARDWARILGGRDKLLQAYLDACVKAGFDRNTPVYLASGLFTYGSTDDNKRNIIRRLTEVSSTLLYKEQVLTSEDTKGLTKEQQALLDFLVMARSQYFVGISVSTFSYYLQEYRSLQGMPPTTAVLLNGRKVGTDPLFKRAATVAAI